MYKVQVIIKRRPSILDPQGKAVEKGAFHMGLTNIKDTRIGKFVEFNVEASDKEQAVKDIEEYCHKLLSNPIMEDYEYKMEEL